MVLNNVFTTRIRYADPDLTIVVGDGGGDDNGVRSHVYHAVVMASQSKYIDTALSSGMRESVEKQLSFPDITPATWDRMMKYIMPGNTEPLSTDEAIVLLEPYGKYNFTVGLHLCDVILAKYVDDKLYNGGGGGDGPLTAVQRRSNCVQVLAKAHALGLAQTTAAGVRQIKRVLLANNTIPFPSSTRKSGTTGNVPASAAFNPVPAPVFLPPGGGRNLWYEIPQGTWKCPTCYIRNGDDRLICISCESDRRRSARAPSAAETDIDDICLDIAALTALGPILAQIDELWALVVEVFGPELPADCIHAVDAVANPFFPVALYNRLRCRSLLMDQNKTKQR